jgi:uncharacterized protein (DUF1697 family)
MKYLALLRGINVGSANRIKMPELKQIFLDAGFEDVQTYIQSGNIIFESRESNEEAVALRLEEALEKGMNAKIRVVLRNAAEMAAIVARSPFDPADPDLSHQFVTFLRAPVMTELPRPPARGDMDFLLFTGRELYAKAKLVEGKWGNAAGGFEKLGTPTTTRNFAVVKALTAMM